MSAANGIRDYAPTTFTLEDRVDTYVPGNFPLGEGDVRRTLAALEVAGHDVAEISDNFERAIRAASRASTPADPATLDLLAMDDDGIADTVRAHGLSRGIAVDVAHALHSVVDAIARQAANTLAPKVDQFVKDMRPDFDKAVVGIAKAAKAGLRPDTQPDTILATGTPEQIKAFRDLPGHVAALDRIASTRTELTRSLKYGPVDWEVAAFVTDVADRGSIEAAHTRFTGPTEHAQYNAPLTGSTIIEVRSKRLGGAWLSLVTGGYTLRLNTGPEATVVVTTAFAKS